MSRNQLTVELGGIKRVPLVDRVELRVALENGVNSGQLTRELGYRGTKSDDVWLSLLTLGDIRALDPRGEGIDERERRLLRELEPSNPLPHVALLMSNTERGIIGYAVNPNSVRWLEPVSEYYVDLTRLLFIAGLSL